MPKSHPQPTRRRSKATLYQQAQERRSKKVTAKQPSVVRRRFTPFAWLGRRSKKVKLILLLIPLMVGGGVWLFWGMPLPSALSDTNLSVSTKIFDRNGKLLYEIYADQRRTPVALGDLPEFISQATIAIEDKDFYSHKGFDLAGIGRAVINTLFKGSLQGGSTLTQQLVKNALLTQERTVRRKAQEAVLTTIVEATYSKDKILEMYLNQIPYGGAAYGIEAASELYFGKKAADLSLAQAALLAGLPAAPTQYSPYGAHPERAKDRQKTVLARMVDEGYITSEQQDDALAEELVFKPLSDLKAPHFVLWIKEQLVALYGERMVEQGGLRVTTTLDLELQETAQKAVADELDKLKKQKVSNGAALITRPASGEILAMVGSKDYFSTEIDGKVNVILAHRQPGSSIKPLNYALAIEDKKVTPATVILDIPTCFSVAGQPLYCPVNYDGTFHGATQIRFALGNSYNIPAVKVLVLNDLGHFIDFAKTMGITTFTDASNYGLSLTLGGGEVRPIDMATAFGVFANGGIRQDLIGIRKIEDWQGKVLMESKTVDLTGQRVLSSETAFLISHILLDNNARQAAFGSSSYLVVSNHPEVSVKTGTTNDRRDNWTIGYTAQAAAVVWVGNNDNSAMSGAVSGVSGASPIWNKLMKAVLDKSEKGYFSQTDKGHAWPLQPEGIVGRLVCATTGFLATGPKENPGCPARFEYLQTDNLPATDSGLRADLQIDRSTGQIARNDTPVELIEPQNHLIIKDPLGSMYCLDCAFPTSATIIKYPLVKQ